MKDDISVKLLRLSLHYNAAIVSMAATYAGNCTNKRNLDRFKKEYKKITEQYNKDVELVIGETNE